GNGNGTFQNHTDFATGSTPFSVAAADLNGDGKLDLVAANSGGSTVSVLLGNGNGSFQTQTTAATGLAPYSVAVGDVNGDGRPDLAVPSLAGNSVGVLLGTGAGDFTGQVYTLSPTASAALPVGPAVQSVVATTPPLGTTSASTVTFTVTFSAAVTGVD